MAPSMIQTIAVAVALIATMQTTEARNVLDLTNGQSQFLEQMELQGGLTHASLPALHSMETCADALRDINMILADQHAFANAQYEAVMDCFKHNRLSNDALPLFVFEGTAVNTTLSKLFGFAPHMEGSVLSVFQKVNRKTLIVDQLSDLEFTGASFDGSISEMGTKYNKEGALTKKTENSVKAIFEENFDKRSLEQRWSEMLGEYLETLEEKIPAFGLVQEDPRIHQMKMSGDTSNSTAPVDTVVILLDNEATMAIPQVGKCSYSKTNTPAAQPNNFIRSWIEITLAIDQPENGGNQAIGQYVNVYHNNEVVTNMARRPGTNDWRSIGWFVGYNKITHSYDDSMFFTHSYAPENVPMNADVSFDTSFTTTFAAKTGDPPSLSYSQATTDGTTVEYTVSDWEVTKVSETINSNGWYHSNNKPYNGQDNAGKFPPTKSNLFDCEITKDGKLYNQKSCNPLWASLLATDDGVCQQNILYRTRANTGYQTQPATFNYRIQTQWSALESWGKSGMFGSQWEACAYFRNYDSGVLNFVVEMDQVQPTLL